MVRVKLTLEYDGTDFVGWQVQRNGRSVQAVVEAGLAVLLGAPVSTVVAGRTDSGVHALGQVVCFDSPRSLPLKAFRRGLNGLLPPDVAVREVEFVSAEFDPRRHTLGKHYRYLISNCSERTPSRRRTHWELFSPLSDARMAEAARGLLGRHDFSSFRAADCEAPHAVRELSEVNVSRPQADEVWIDVVGTAFLKHMVRNLVGSLVEVGRHKQAPQWIREVLEARDRTLAGPTAPAHGLTLVEVRYPPRA